MTAILAATRKVRVDQEGYVFGNRFTRRPAPRVVFYSWVKGTVVAGRQAPAHSLTPHQEGSFSRNGSRKERKRERMCERVKMQKAKNTPVVPTGPGKSLATANKSRSSQRRKNSYHELYRSCLRARRELIECLIGSGPGDEGVLRVQFLGFVENFEKLWKDCDRSWGPVLKEIQKTTKYSFAEIETMSSPYYPNVPTYWWQLLTLRSVKEAVRTKTVAHGVSSAGARSRLRSVSDKTIDPVKPEEVSLHTVGDDLGEKGAQNKSSSSSQEAEKARKAQKAREYFEKKKQQENEMAYKDIVPGPNWTARERKIAENWNKERNRRSYWSHDS